MFPCANRNTNIYEFGSLKNLSTDSLNSVSYIEKLTFKRTKEHGRCHERYKSLKKSMLTPITAEYCRSFSTKSMVRLLSLQGV